MCLAFSEVCLLCPTAKSNGKHELLEAATEAVSLPILQLKEKYLTTQLKEKTGKL